MLITFSDFMLSFVFLKKKNYEQNIWGSVKKQLRLNDPKNKKGSKHLSLGNFMQFLVITFYFYIPQDSQVGWLV